MPTVSRLYGLRLRVFPHMHKFRSNEVSTDTNSDDEEMMDGKVGRLLRMQVRALELVERLLQTQVRTLTLPYYRSVEKRIADIDGFQRCSNRRQT